MTFAFLVKGAQRARPLRPPGQAPVPSPKRPEKPPVHPGEGGVLRETTVSSSPACRLRPCAPHPCTPTEPAASQPTFPVLLTPTS